MKKKQAKSERVLVIPDVHLKPWMFKEADRIMQDGKADRTVCLMDLADEWGKEYDTDIYKETYEAACEFQAKHEDTVWCCGNHDLAYLWLQIESGFSPLAGDIVQDGIRRLRQAVPDLDQIGYIHRIGNILFSHAGLTDLYVKQYVFPCLMPEERDIDSVIEKINSFGKNRLWNNDSPIWVRPQERFSGEKPEKLLYRPEKYTQVVGHTPVKKAEKTGPLISTDVFSVRSDGSFIGDNAFPIIDTKAGEIIETVQDTAMRIRTLGEKQL